MFGPSAVTAVGHAIFLFSKSFPRWINNLFEVCSHSQCRATLGVQNLGTTRCNVMSSVGPSVSLKPWHRVIWAPSTERTRSACPSCTDFPRSSVNRLHKSANFRGRHGGWMLGTILTLSRRLSTLSCYKSAWHFYTFISNRLLLSCIDPLN